MGKIGMLTLCPVLEVFTVKNCFSKSTFFQSSRQQSPRRIAVHIPITIMGRIKSSVIAALEIAASSSGVNGWRNTVSVSRVGWWPNGPVRVGDGKNTLPAMARFHVKKVFF
jgi:hypothetical protein